MKKIALIAVSALFVAVSTQAQGFVSFNNSAAAGSKISTNSVVGGVATGLAAGASGSYYYALFYSASATAVNGSSSATVPAPNGITSFVWNDSSWNFSGAYATNSATVGRVSGSTAQAVSGVAGGGSADFVIIGWSANLGTTWQQAQAAYLAGVVGFLGQSAVSPSVTIGDGGSIPTPTILAASGAVAGFTLGLTPTPEPGTIALAGLGIASLLALRRKK